MREEVQEVAGAMGLILPGLLHIRPMLTPLAACELLIEMIGAMGVTLLRGEGSAALLLAGRGFALCSRHLRSPVPQMSEVEYVPLEI